MNDETKPPTEIYAALSAGNTIHLECGPDDFDPDVVLHGPWRYVLAAPSPTEAQIEAAAPRDWLIRRHGAWFRPNAQGYSSEIAGAGTYTEAEARRWDASGIEGLTIHHFSQGGVAEEIAAVLAGADRLKAALSAPPTTDAGGWRAIATAPKDGTRFWGKIDDDAIAMLWHDGFQQFVSSWQRMTMAPGYTIDGEPFKDHSAVHHDPDYWMPIPPDAAMAQQVTQGGRDE